MRLAIGIFLLLVGFVASFTAIGGETWRKEENLQWRQRITRRGWISVICILAAFLFSITDRVIEDIENSNKLLKQTRQTEEETKRADELQVRLKVAQEELQALRAEQAQGFQGVGRETTQLKSQLTDASRELADFRLHLEQETGVVQTQLRSTQQDLIDFGEQIDREINVAKGKIDSLQRPIIRAVLDIVSKIPRVTQSVVIGSAPDLDGRRQIYPGERELSLSVRRGDVINWQHGGCDGGFELLVEGQSYDITSNHGRLLVSSGSPAKASSVSYSSVSFCEGPLVLLVESTEGDKIDAELDRIIAALGKAKP